MSKYRVSIPWLCTFSVTVEAENEDAAVEKAYANATPTVCVHCVKEIQLGECNDNADPSAEEVKD